MADTREINVHNELTEAPIAPFHKRLGILVTLITLFDGYDTFNPAYVIHYVMQPWGLAPSHAGFLVSSGLIGFLFGAIGQGFISDRFGRRGALIGGLWIVNVFTVATALFAHDFWTFWPPSDQPSTSAERAVRRCGRQSRVRGRESGIEKGLSRSV